MKKLTKGILSLIPGLLFWTFLVGISCTETPVDINTSTPQASADSADSPQPAQPIDEVVRTFKPGEIICYEQRHYLGVYLLATVSSEDPKTTPPKIFFTESYGQGWDFGTSNDVEAWLGSVVDFDICKIHVMKFNDDGRVVLQIEFKYDSSGHPI